MLIKNVKSWYFQDTVVVMAGKKSYAASSFGKGALLWNNQEAIHVVYQEIIKLDLLTC